MSSHTPGPWHVEYTRAPKMSQIGHNNKVRNSEGIYIVDGLFGIPGDADANFIASAPDLLAAIVELERAADPHQNMSDIPVYDALARARQAIARATLSPEAYAEAQMAAGDVAEAVEERAASGG